MAQDVEDQRGKHNVCDELCQHRPVRFGDDPSADENKAQENERNENRNRLDQIRENHNSSA